MNSEQYETLLDNLQCPLCCLAMLPPLRAPMVLPQCGHTICETCISKLRECPFCHSAFSKPVRNVVLLQIIDTLDHQKLIPTWLNPPPPTENKLIPKIEPICTVAATGSNYIDQRFYHCRTCNIIGDCGVCEVCARNCHKGHDIYIGDDALESYCDCKDCCNCKCLPKTKSFRCSFEITYGCPVEQPMFQCLDCNITNDEYICQSCAIKCHYGHKLKYFAKVKGKVCHCLDRSVCKIAFRNPICTYLLSGKKYISQPWYRCKTCGLVDGYGCCSVCAHHCHKGHDLVYEGVYDECFCDCGDGYLKKKCCMLEFTNSSYLTRCTNCCIEHKDKIIKQRMYHCATCGMRGICEACAINCHINHAIEYVGISDFCCGCQNTQKCIMSLVPMLHNNRNKCDRSVLDTDDISACYTCYKCDRSGKLKICETCALKNHINHDVHLIGYMQFNCSESQRPKTSRSPQIFKPKRIVINA